MPAFGLCRFEFFHEWRALTTSRSAAPLLVATGTPWRRRFRFDEHRIVAVGALERIALYGGPEGEGDDVVP